MLPFNHDLHVHTNLSLCAKDGVEAGDYISFCEKEGIEVIGFSNHLYLDRVLKKRGYDETGLNRALRLKDEINELRKTTDVKILFGCEVENYFGQSPSLDPADAGHFDYILIAASHILNAKNEYKNYDLSTPDKLRKMVVDQFVRACGLNYSVPTCICHPLYPILSPDEQEVVDGISDKELEELFLLAKEKNKAIEVHSCLYRNGTKLNDHGVSDSYIRLLSIAKKCGCKFSFGSDAHRTSDFSGKHVLLHTAARLAGITEKDMWEI